MPEEKTGDLSPRHRGPGAGRGRRPGEGVPGASGGAAGGPPGQPPQGPLLVSRVVQGSGAGGAWTGCVQLQKALGAG